ncbi:MAG: hypothetical protein WC846_03165 [Candidatus Gracilibacteria bacterium]|jgi:hypothetical protein
MSETDPSLHIIVPIVGTMSEMPKNISVLGSGSDVAREQAVELQKFFKRMDDPSCTLAVGDFERQLGLIPPDIVTDCSFLIHSDGGCVPCGYYSALIKVPTKRAFVPCFAGGMASSLAIAVGDILASNDAWFRFSAELSDVKFARYALDVHLDFLDSLLFRAVSRSNSGVTLSIQTQRALARDKGKADCPVVLSGGDLSGLLTGLRTVNGVDNVRTGFLSFLSGGSADLDDVAGAVYDDFMRVVSECGRSNILTIAFPAETACA